MRKLARSLALAAVLAIVAIGFLAVPTFADGGPTCCLQLPVVH